MDSLLRDLDRERAKIRRDVDNLNRHYEQLAGYVAHYLQQATAEWARLLINNPFTLLLIIETTRIVDENGGTYGESEPIRFTMLSLANGQIWDQLLRPTQSKSVTGTEYHGLSMTDLAGKPTIGEAWDEIAQQLATYNHIVIFGADYARTTVNTVYRTPLFDDAFCLHNKAKEFYGEFYELTLKKVLGYQGIYKKREQLKDSRERILLFDQIVNNLAAGMPKQGQEPKTLDNLDLDEHPF